MNNPTNTRMIESALKLSSRKNHSDSRKLANQSIGCILHVGAGNGTELVEYLTLNAEKIVLVEPVQKLAKKLHRMTQDQNVEVINVALSPEAGSKRYYEVIPARYSGLNQPEELIKLFHNLKIKQSNDVKTLSLSELLKEQSLDASRHNILVLQVNGAEYDCLAQIIQEELSLFSTLIVQTGNKIYFKNAHSSDELVELLLSKGFQLDFQSIEDTVFTNLIFSKDKFTELLLDNEQQKTALAKYSHKLDSYVDENTLLLKKIAGAEKKSKKKTAQLVKTNEDQVVKNGTLQSALDKAKKEIEIGKVRIDEASKKVARLSHLEELHAKLLADEKSAAEILAKVNLQQNVKNGSLLSAKDEVSHKLEENMVELDEALKDVERLSHLKESNAKLLAEEKAKADDLTKVNLEQIEENKTIQVALDEAYQDIEESKVQLEYSSNRLSKLSHSKASLSTRMNSAKAMIISLSKKEEAQIKQNQTIQVTLDKTKVELKVSQAALEGMVIQRNQRQRAADLAQKTLAKVHIDLDDLRIKYREKFESEKMLLELVRELREKLSLASEYYFRLQNNHPELLDDSSNESTSS